jgi:hypothetical protein
LIDKWKPVTVTGVRATLRPDAPYLYETHRASARARVVKHAYGWLRHDHERAEQL